MNVDDLTISVIVPIYKVEPYLRQCLDSLVGQTYRNLEIILVDDGSPDNCGAICDEYAAKDQRIKVIHQANGGVSAARNAGLAAATGHWIGWVDGDDWAEADMYEYLLENALKYEADVAVCGRVERYADRDVVWGWDTLQVWNQEQVIAQLLEDQALRNYLCDKLWKRKLFDGICFPEGEIFEDIIVTCQLLLKTNTVIGLPEAKYNYRQRLDSIVKSQSLAQRVSYVQAARQQMETLKESWPQYEDQMAAQCVAAAIGLWMTYDTAPKEERVKYRQDIRQAAVFAREYQKVVLKYRKLGLAGRLVLRLVLYNTWWSFMLACFIGKLYKLRHGRPL